MLNGWCLIKIGVVVGIDTWTLLATRNFRCGIELTSTLVSNHPSLVDHRWNLEPSPSFQLLKLLCTYRLNETAENWGTSEDK